MGDLVLAAGLLLATPAQLVTAQVVGSAVTLVLHRRQRGLKLAFNVASTPSAARMRHDRLRGALGPVGLLGLAGRAGRRPGHHA